MAWRGTSNACSIGSGSTSARTDMPGRISFTAQLRGMRNTAHSNYATDYFRMDAVGSDGLVVTGKSADYLGVAGLSNELQQKLAKVRPATLGQAGRIDGMTPAALALILARIRQSTAKRRA